MGVNECNVFSAYVYHDVQVRMVALCFSYVAKSFAKLQSLRLKHVIQLWQQLITACVTKQQP